MNSESEMVSTMESGGFPQLITNGMSRAVTNRKIRAGLIKALEIASYRACLKKEPDRPERVKLEKFYMARALLNSVGRALAEGRVSEESIKALTNVFLSKVFMKSIYTRENLKDENGFRPPGFVTISPTNVCNLRCKGCYAGDVYEPHSLDFDVLDRIISEMKNKFSSNFFVISGGEPFMYRSKGKTLIDILAKHRDAFFMCYTNGTLIDEKMAEELARLGNLTPSISVEGFEEETDERRGKGTYRKIMEAMDNLRGKGVMFGISVTPCSHNADLLLSDEFIDFFFKEKGAFYGWYFQYMPIGRNPSLNLMVTPHQRFEMWETIWEKVKKDRLFIADFWNSGVASDGCICAARDGGYFYIMWDGTVTPCVFIPFADKDYSNICEVYERGESLLEIINSPFFTALRRWQSEYWMDQPKERCGNLLCPCIIRDNSEDFHRIVKETGAKPADDGARTYLSLIEDGKMPEYNRSYRELVDPIWGSEYLGKKREE